MVCTFVMVMDVLVGPLLLLVLLLLVLWDGRIVRLMMSNWKPKKGEMILVGSVKRTCTELREFIEMSGTLYKCRLHGSNTNHLLWNYARPLSDFCTPVEVTGDMVEDAMADCPGGRSKATYDEVADNINKMLNKPKPEIWWDINKQLTGSWLISKGYIPILVQHYIDGCRTDKDNFVPNLAVRGHWIVEPNTLTRQPEGMLDGALVCYKIHADWFILRAQGIWKWKQITEFVILEAGGE